MDTPSQERILMRFSISVPEDTWRHLRRLAAAKDISLSALVREIVMDWSVGRKTFEKEAAERLAGIERKLEENERSRT